MKKGKLDTEPPNNYRGEHLKHKAQFLKPPDCFDWRVLHPSLRQAAFGASTSFILHTLTGLLLAGLVSCSNISQFGMSAIGANVTAIRTLTQQQNNSTVYIQGKVEKIVPLLQQRVYQINDSTGKIWVLTNQTGWREGEQVVVRGKLRYQSIPLANKEFGEIYVEEE
ncbi:MAG: DNA-binding protein [Heteroscytonema crispum UTEX LB 1556]